METLFSPLIGRFGNQLFQYVYARAYAEQSGCELCVGDWIGDRIFDIPKSRKVHMPDITLPQDYRQNQQSLIYTRSQVKDWLKVKPELLQAMSHIGQDDILAHQRIGDYLGCGFPVISTESYLKAFEKFGYKSAHWITEENPTVHATMHENLRFLPDFIRMMRCKVLFRGNSTFSWWAATLGDCKVYSPIVKGVGLVGGKECDVEFVEGNHPACSDFDFVSDLHLKP